MEKQDRDKTLGRKKKLKKVQDFVLGDVLGEGEACAVLQSQSVAMPNHSTTSSMYTRFSF